MSISPVENDWIKPGGDIGLALNEWLSAATNCSDKTSGPRWERLIEARIRLLLEHQKKMTSTERIERADRTIKQLRTMN